MKTNIKFPTQLRKVIYKTGNYDAWANSLWQRGYKYTIQDIEDLLGVSERWIELYMDIHYVVYTNKFIYSKRAGTQLRRVDIEEVKDWFIKNSTFEVQTEVIDLYPYLKLANPKSANKVYEKYKRVFEKYKDFYNKGTIPESVWNLIRQEFVLSSNLGKNVNVLENHNTEKYPWKAVEPFDFFKYEYSSPHQKASYRPEINYRNAFLKGYVKVTLGGKKGGSKVVYVKKEYPIDKMKMPLVIKYGGKVSVQGKC